MASKAALMAVVEALRAEQERRAKMRGQEIGNAREVLYRKLDTMAANRERLGSPLPPMTPSELADLESYLSDRADAEVKG
jgi:hypothetical protein